MSYPTPLTLEGRQAVVAGGTKGTGAAVVTRLKAAGAVVTAIARTPGPGTDADTFIAADLTDPDAGKAIAESVTAGGVPEVLVHVTGGSTAPSGGFAVLGDAE
ncbi:hypothetical protein [Rhodococcus sp. T7]|uniref:hypothetical protein n=1 Tax=Rhodococcus sp. T7 TaxID=627444 RepID=UPI0013CABE1A|nr:hypothetical protein [Rhodococcus sp. T7]KAF0963355.1 hypothetical protein MLGJGCBP_03517 [Rhodococcus sp. T7]